MGSLVLGEYEQNKRPTGWWFFTNPSEKYAKVKLGSSSPNRGENHKNV